jgi:chorismate mutase-like protein
MTAKKSRKTATAKITKQAQDRHLLAADVLKKHRQKIDKIDVQLMKLLGQRFGVVRDVAKVKIQHDIPAFLGGRVNEVRNNAVAHGKKYGVDPDFVRTLYTMLIYQSCAEEEVLKHEAQQKAQKQKKISKKK